MVERVKASKPFYVYLFGQTPKDYMAIDWA